MKKISKILTLIFFSGIINQVSADHQGGSGRGRGNYYQVVRYCEAYEINNYDGYTVRSYTAVAQGRRGTGIKHWACNKAMRKCQRNKSYYNYCSSRRHTYNRGRQGRGGNRDGGYNRGGRRGGGNRGGNRGGNPRRGPGRGPF